MRMTPSDDALVWVHALRPALPLSHQQELKAEAPDAPLLMTKDTLERALMARLMDPPAIYPQWPVPYL